MESECGLPKRLLFSAVCECNVAYPIFSVYFKFIDFHKKIIYNYDDRRGTDVSLIFQDTHTYDPVFFIY